MEYQRFILGSLKTNSYLLIDPKTQQATVVDPAYEGGFISQKIIDQGLNLQAIILTHGHFDHLNGLFELKLNFADTPIMLHKKDFDLYKKSPDSTRYWTHQTPDPLPEIDQFITSEQTIKLGSSNLQVIHTPGHTPGSICLYNQKANLLFSGDTLFKHGRGRTDFSYSNPARMKKSLHKLSQLPGHTKILSGHGDPTTISREFNK